MEFEDFLASEEIMIDLDDYETTSLADAGVDSLLILQWAVLIEEQAGRPVIDDLLGSVRTIGDLKHYYDKLTAE